MACFLKGLPTKSGLIHSCGQGRSFYEGSTPSFCDPEDLALMMLADYPRKGPRHASLPKPELGAKVTYLAANQGHTWSASSRWAAWAPAWPPPCWQSRGTLGRWFSEPPRLPRSSDSPSPKGGNASLPAATRIKGSLRSVRSGVPLAL